MSYQQETYTHHIVPKTHQKDIFPRTGTHKQKIPEFYQGFCFSYWSVKSLGYLSFKYGRHSETILYISETIAVNREIIFSQK